ncbi:hypothetical protein CEE37_06495 [candidate division LCP-89 bacterium B3_LCP]|uniref:Flagellar assembly protein T N-terminal domain-containing protein n=1 Tax=candidate division LCP-89 bacterium B3_LCP TaxID=2012998 RepID=A0A532V0E7_UNCL8|nr:MAG: hypothetical protein CEE37_06495 [candidate division LCP-89 bacterium B3_LCP]
MKRNSVPFVVVIAILLFYGFGCAPPKPRFVGTKTIPQKPTNKEFDNSKGTASNKISEIIDIIVRGISDNQRDGQQKDRKEAIMDAKLQALERAGSSIESYTMVENFELKYDLIQSSANAVLLPGFEIIDNGYGEDGTYSVVLIGKIKVNK